ncbi:MAG: potassium transporter Kup [Planctomycetes bacterium]|nr:potassium transporter Kup [Planctomycetota bacterium]
MLWLSLGALGVVYGDIGTSPLYALKECFAPGRGIGLSPPEILGVLSLMFWALVLVVTVKYLGFILRADNHGEGGVLALSALLGRSGPRRGKTGLMVLGLFGAALLYGDGIITPAITVLSAFELKPAIAPYAIPCAMAVLTALFVLQPRGTERVGAVFGPIMIAWFLVLAILGGAEVVRHPEVLQAVFPWHGVRFLGEHGGVGLAVLGVVVLVVTGAEALYADMGHFGARPIRLVWIGFVLPALVLNYFGQGALLMHNPEFAERPLFALAPEWFQVPLLVLAILASMIASQAIISGTFSLTRQAIQLGYCPRMRVVHTSPREIGQIYIPEVNWLLWAATLALVLGFRTSSALATAYGVAVTTTMLITTVLFCVVARAHFGWRRRTALLVSLPFLFIDLAFFGANMWRLEGGAWVPLVLGVLVYVLMSTWQRGRALLAERLQATLPSIQDFIRVVQHGNVPRVPGHAVFLTGNSDLAPPGILHNLKHNRILHEEVAFLTILTEDVPRVEEARRVEVHDLGDGFYKVVARFGFMEDPDVPEMLTRCRAHGMDFPPAGVSFFLSRQRFLPTRKPTMSLWRQKLFAVLTRNTLGATAYFRIPPSQVVELGSQVQL